MGWISVNMQGEQMLTGPIVIKLTLKNVFKHLLLLVYWSNNGRVSFMTMGPAIRSADIFLLLHVYQLEPESVSRWTPCKSGKVWAAFSIRVPEKWAKSRVHTPEKGAINGQLPKSRPPSQRGPNPGLQTHVQVVLSMLISSWIFINPNVNNTLICLYNIYMVVN